MRILIIGGTGLISTGITRQLLERGEDVTLYNRGQREAEIPVPVEPRGEWLLPSQQMDPHPRIQEWVLAAMGSSG